MSKPTIQYRPFRPSDYKPLEDIICKTWEYDKFCSPKIAKRISKLYLASSLVNQTYTCVAVNNGEPVGIIMGKNEATYQKPLRYSIRQALFIASIAISSEGRKMAEIFEKIDTIDDDLLEDADTFFEGELAFFVVRDDQRGTGIGKTLYQYFLKYMKSEHLENFFLFTDNTSNFGFYEYQGLTRLSQEDMSLPPMKTDMQFYLYASPVVHKKITKLQTLV